MINSILLVGMVSYCSLGQTGNDLIENADDDDDYAGWGSSVLEKGISVGVREWSRRRFRNDAVFRSR